MSIQKPQDRRCIFDKHTSNKTSLECCTQPEPTFQCNYTTIFSTEDSGCSLLQGKTGVDSKKILMQGIISLLFSLPNLSLFHTDKKYVRKYNTSIIYQSCKIIFLTRFKNTAPVVIRIYFYSLPVLRYYQERNPQNPNKFLFKSALSFLCL